MTKVLLATSCIFASLASAASQTSEYNLEIQTTAPKSAIKVPGDFFSFGFETAFLPHFQNEFSENMVNSIGDRMSKPLIIRIGGTSGDLVQFSENQTEAAHCVGPSNCPHSSKDTFILGKSYFEGFKSFPKAHMTFQAPIYPKKGDYEWIEEAMDYVRRAANALGKDRIAAIALGNEPDYYEYGQQKYISRSLELEQRIIKDLKLEGDDQRIFELGDIPDSVIEKRGGKWGLSQLLKNELNKNGLGKFAAQHYYQITNKQDVPGMEGVQNLLMNHKAIADRFPKIEENINYIHENDEKIAFVISEAGSIIGGEPVNISAAFGAALWAVDFHLTAMTRGVKRVSNTMRPEATHAFWIPDDSGTERTTGPSVHGIFPSAAFIADFVGKNSPGKAVEINLPGHPEYFSAYAMYNQESGKIERIALVNLKSWYPGLNTDRGHASIRLNVGDDVKDATLHRMHADKGSIAMGFDLGGFDDNATWAGEQWSYKIDQGKGHFPHGHEEDKLKITEGSIKVEVPDTEACIVHLE